MKKFQYVIAYDIKDDKTRTKIFRILRSYGIHAEKSVFECKLTPTSIEHLKWDIVRLMNPETDILRIYRLTATASEAIFSFGKVLDDIPIENFLVF